MNLGSSFTSEANFLYKVNRDGTGFQVLLQFPAVPEGGHQPRTYLLWADDGFFYGTARRGGVGDRGVLFKIKPDGSDYYEFHRFLGSEAGDGADVRSGLVLGVDGALYGVTTGGGNLGHGTVFRVNRDGGDYRIVHHFGGFPAGDGSSPHARLLAPSDGWLYGTTQFGGLAPNEPYGGIVFKVRTDGAGYQVLHRFDESLGEGEQPYAMAKHGNH